MSILQGKRRKLTAAVALVCAFLSETGNPSCVLTITDTDEAQLPPARRVSDLRDGSIPIAKGQRFVCDSEARPGDIQGLVLRASYNNVDAELLLPWHDGAPTETESYALTLVSGVQKLTAVGNPRLQGFVGCMGAGKTSVLIKRARRNPLAIILTNQGNEVISRNSALYASLSALPFGSVSQEPGAALNLPPDAITALLERNPGATIYVDEAQFLSIEQLTALRNAAERFNCQVELYFIAPSFAGTPLGVAAQILWQAGKIWAIRSDERGDSFCSDEPEFVGAPLMMCQNCGKRPASLHARYNGDRDMIVLRKDVYKSVCPCCLRENEPEFAPGVLARHEPEFAPGAPQDAV
jgi:thymidine kinase